MGQQTIATYTGVLDRDVAQAIMLTQEAMETPIYSMLVANGAKVPTIAEKFEWQTDAFAARRTAVDNVADDYDETDTEIVVDDASAFYPNCLVYAEATGEIMLCTATNDGTETITVVRGLGSVVAAHADSVANNANLLNIGSAEGEGKGAPAARQTSRVTVENWVQTFRHTVELSGRLARVKKKTEEERAYQRQFKFREHLRDIEHAIIFGAADGSTADADSKNVTTTGGFLQAISTHVDNIGGAMSQTEFDAFCEKAFAQGSGQKTFFCGATALAAIVTLYRDNVRNASSETAVGINIKQVITNYGIANLVFNRRLGTGNAGTIVSVDLDNTKLRVTDGGDTQLLPDRQNPDADAFKDEWFSEFGLEWGDEANHAKALGITGAE